MKNLKKKIERNNRKHRTGKASNLNKDGIFSLPRKAGERERERGR
jgi:predicted RecA/RadA family phage recombinase